MTLRLSLFLFLVLVLGGGFAIGFVTLPGEWYAQLAKPAFTPPNWIFPPMWSAIYVLIAIAGWHVWHHDRAGLPMKLWWVQLALNFLWSPTFFGARQMGIALIVILLMLVTILAFIAASWRREHVSALLFMPYAAWAVFASLLNASIFAMN
jgi:translocator protein